MRAKRFLIIPILLLLLHGFPYSVMGDEIPAPFAKAKEMCLRVQPDVYGRHLIIFELQDTSIIVYVLGYLSQQMIIGIGKQEDGPLIVGEYHEQTKEFTIYMQGMRMEVSKDKVIEFAFKIFRELVEKKLI